MALLDVRRSEEHEESHVKGAHSIPIHELPRRLGDVPQGEVWVHCESGYRSSIAASLIDAAGRTPVAIDDDFENAKEVGLPLEGSF